MITTTILQLLILVFAMSASAAIGFWVAREQQAVGSLMDQNKMAQTIEQLRERATQAEADKVRALIAAERDRKRAEVWRPARMQSAA